MSNYIVSLKHTRKSDEFITLWRQNNQGYCYAKEDAGIYEEPKDGYHNNDNNIPVDIDRANVFFVSAKMDGKIKEVIPNTPAFLNIIGCKFIKNSLCKKT